MTEELLAQQLQKFLVFKFHRKAVARAACWCFSDNRGVAQWLEDGAARHAFQSALVSLSDVIAFAINTLWISTWCSTEDMKAAGADALSRESYRYFRGIRVFKVNQSVFTEFKRYFNQGTREYFKTLIWTTVGLQFPQ